MRIGQLDTNKIVVTDFETFFDSTYSLRSLRNEEYILDRRFKIHGMATADFKGKTDWIDGPDIGRWLKSHRNLTIVNHKLTFDGLIWKLVYNHVAPFMVDTLYLANAIHGPAEVSGGNDLDSVAHRLGFQPKGKVDMFKGKYDLSPEEMLAMKAYACNDADLTFKVFKALLPMLSRPEFELWLIDHSLRIYIERPLPVVPKLCHAAIKKVEARVKGCMAELPKIDFTFSFKKPYTEKGIRKNRIITQVKTVDESVLASNPQFAQALVQVFKSEGEKIPMKQGRNGRIPALAKADEEFAALKSHDNKKIRGLVIARIAKRSADTQIARLRTLLKCAAVGGFRVYLNYWGAHTGRWTGGSGLNAHNFPNPTRSPDEFEREVAALIRACVVPGKGKKYTATDAANIEARVLAWWAGETELVNAFGDGTDVYSSFASEAFKEEVRKPRPDDKPEAAKRFKLLRNVGKATVLGLGYGMGNTPFGGSKYGKFESNLRASPDVRPLFDTGELNTKKCDELLAKYRGKYTKIVALWSRVEAAFFQARDGKQRMVNGVLFSKGRKCVEVTLPSGRICRYYNVRMGEKQEGRRPQWVFGHGKGRKLYGSLLVENIVQAISRDILAESVYAMEQAGYEVSHHVHDSVCTRVPAGKAKAAMAFSIEALSTSPAWGEGMRLGAEGEITETFP